MRKKIFFALLFFIIINYRCYEEPVWCNATLYLTIKNKTDKDLNCSYEPIPEHNKWKDSLTIKQNTTVNSITLKNRILIIDSMNSYTDTIVYTYYQSDGPCARSYVNSNILSISLVINSNEKKKLVIYPWDPKIHGDNCSGCENINYDTIVIK